MELWFEVLTTVTVNNIFFLICNTEKEAKNEASVAYFLILKVEAICSSETSKFFGTTQHCNTNDPYSKLNIVL